MPGCPENKHQTQKPHGEEGCPWVLPVKYREVVLVVAKFHVFFDLRGLHFIKEFNKSKEKRIMMNFELEKSIFLRIPKSNFLLPKSTLFRHLVALESIRICIFSRKTEKRRNKTSKMKFSKNQVSGSQNDPFSAQK